VLRIRSGGPLSFFIFNIKDKNKNRRGVLKRSSKKGGGPKGASPLGVERGWMQLPKGGRTPWFLYLLEF